MPVRQGTGPSLRTVTSRDVDGARVLLGQFERLPRCGERTLRHGELV